MKRSLVTVFLFGFIASSSLADEAAIKPFVAWLLEDESRLEDVRFAEVAEAVSGKKVLPVDIEDSIDQLMLGHLENVLDQMIIRLADPEHSIHEVGRVNEISRHIEEFLLFSLNNVEGLQCTIPVNASGDLQRSGYPDLRLLHEKTGRVFYIDPKVYKAGSEGSSFRTFYFEPKLETNKILDDASHLIVGIAHSGKQDELWKLDAWSIVDLIDFRVRLKAEFQASNRDLYLEDAVLSHSAD